MIAGVHQTRTIVILVLLLVAGTAGLYYGVRWFGRELSDKPYVANVKLQLRALAAAEQRVYDSTATYTPEVGRVWRPSETTRGIGVRIVAADSTGFLAEGRHDAWTGWCVIAVGPQAGDSLPRGEPVCHWGER